MVDVCLILEGTYPYVVGGVSKWTHALVKNLSEIEFSIVHLHSGEERKIKFEVPENVKSKTKFSQLQTKINCDEASKFLD